MVWHATKILIVSAATVKMGFVAPVVTVAQKLRIAPALIVRSLRVMMLQAAREPEMTRLAYQINVEPTLILRMIPRARLERLQTPAASTIPFSATAVPIKARRLVLALARAIPIAIPVLIAMGPV